MTKHVDKPFDMISGSNALNFTVFANQSKLYGSYWRILNELFFADPLFMLLVNWNRRVTASRTHIRKVERPIFNLTVRNHSPHLSGLRILFALLHKRARARHHAAFPSWNRRRSLTLHGCMSTTPNVVNTIGTLMSTLNYPVGIDAIKVDLTRYNSTGGLSSHLGFDGLRRLALRLYPFIGLTFQWPMSLGRYTQHKLAGLTATEDSIVYTLRDVIHQSYPSSQSFRAPSLTVSIRRLSNDEGNSIVIEISGLENVVVNGNPSLPKLGFTSKAIGIQYVNHNVSVSALHSYYRQVQSWAIDIDAFRPAFYHTGCKALTSCMADYSRNFENLVESSELVSLFTGVINAPKLSSGGRTKPGKIKLPVPKPGQSILKLPDFILGIREKNISHGTRVARIAKAFSGGYLSYAFALKPTYESVVGLVNRVVLPISSEAEMKFTLTTLPLGLKALLFSEARMNHLGFTFSQVLKCDVKFRTTVHVCPDHQSLAQAFLDANPALNLGIVPSPEAIWAIGRYTFIIDWFFNVSRLIRDLTTWLMSPAVPFKLGHTARIQIDLDDGRSFDLFFRSTQGNQLTSPPLDSWLGSVGLQSVSIPLVVSKIFGGA